MIVVGFEPSVLSPIANNLRFDNFSLPAGASVQVVASVPTGELWRMTTFTMFYAGTVAGVTLRARVVIGASTMPFFYVAPPVTQVPYTILCSILLDDTCDVDISIGGATLNDDITGIMFCERIK